MPVLSTLPQIPAIPTWVNGIRRRAARRAPRERMAILEAHGVALLGQAARLARSPNWAESYVEGAWLLADDFGALTGLSRQEVSALWRTRLPHGQQVALNQSVPLSFRNTAGLRY
jgi:hypothetical protein